MKYLTKYFKVFILCGKECYIKIVEIEYYWVKVIKLY